MDLLRCSVCLDTYDDPFLLPSCGHTFCRGCVDRVTQTASNWRGQHSCPTCRSPFRVSEPRPNYALRQLLADSITPQTDSLAIPGTVATANGRRLTREIGTSAESDVPAQPDSMRIERLQKLGVPYGMAKLLDEEDRQIGRRIFLLDNSGSTGTLDGHIFEEIEGGRLVSRPCSRWEEIKRIAVEQAKWNAMIGTPCEFVLLNPGPGPLQEGRDFVRLESDGGPGAEKESLDSLSRMLNRTYPNGPTPLARRLEEIYERIRGQHEELVRRGQRVVLVVATDGLPTGQPSESAADCRRRVVNILKRLGTELSVFIVVRLTTDDDDVVQFYNEVDDELELPLEVLDDIESEAKEIRDHGNGWLAYSPLLHRIREGGTFVKLFDLLDERCFTPTEVSVFTQLLLRQEDDDPMPRSAEDFCEALQKAVGRAQLVYDPLLRRMVPPIHVSQACSVVVPTSVRIAAAVRSFFQMVSSVAEDIESVCGDWRSARAPMGKPVWRYSKTGRTELVF